MTSERPDRRLRPPEYESRMLSAEHLARLRERVTAVAAEYWRAAAGVDADNVAAAVEDFFVLYPERPVPDNSGGSGFNDCLWIYCAARLLMPALIVECGVYKGQTTWFLRRAAPRAEIIAFDLDLDQREWRDDAARYHAGDWSQVPVHAADPARSLAFFDDHVSHARRIREAYARGFRTLLLGDDLAAESLHATGRPPAPTVSMILDERLRDGERLVWLRHGVEREHVVDAAELAAARALIAGTWPMPDLAPVTRFRPQSGLTLVRLVG